MAEFDEDFRRGDTRERTQRDLYRFRRREPSGGFWHSFGLIGSVGWPIVLLATGGALLGRFIDGRLDSGIRATLVLLTVGTAIGSFVAYRVLRGGGS